MSFKKLGISLLLLSSLVLLAACQSENKTSTSGSSSSKKVEKSSPSQSSSNEYDEEEDLSSDEELEEKEAEITEQTGVVAKNIVAYKAPSNIDELVGTYHASGYVESKSKGLELDLNIEEDGTYRLVSKHYDVDLTIFTESSVANYGYFDKKDSLQSTQVRTRLGDREFGVIGEISYTEGILVEKFGEVYFQKRLEYTSDGGVPFFNQDGQLDVAKTVFKRSIKDWASQNYVLPILSHHIEEFKRVKLTYQGEYKTSDDLSNMDDKIENNLPLISTLKLEKSTNVNELVTEDLNDILNEDWFADIFKTTNGVFQYDNGPLLATAGTVGSPYFTEDTKPTKLTTDEFYTKEGDKIEPDAGYISGEEATVVYDEKIYRQIKPVDGKFIIKSNLY